MGFESLKKIRRHLHQNPEVSNKEKQTANFVKEQLLERKPTEILTNVGGYGICATFAGKEEGNHVLLRCELDALPIHEKSDLEYKSNMDGVSHLCGHDGHMTILIGIADYLYQCPLEKGKVSLLFQPAEETGEGARRVLTDKIFKERISPDYVISFHNIPGFKKGEVLLKSENFTPSVISCKIELTGKTSHASEPEKGISPVLAIARIIEGASNLEKQIGVEDRLSLITPIFISCGNESYGISPGDATLGFTLRSWSNDQLDNLKDSFNDLVGNTAKQYSLKGNIHWLEEFRSVENNAFVTNVIANAAKELGMNCKTLFQPFKFGEDFGLFTEEFKGAMFGIGAGINHPSLHNPDYDFPDEILTSSIHLNLKIIQNLIYH